MPNPLPPGAHRVISEMTAAEMRKMMEGVVLYGTGKPAQLNGYSSGGKTGTAQKIDPVTHTYSKTMHIASFAGIAPVNNPVISVVVVIDNPRGGSYYGTAVSAPVFADVAQQVLEYLGVAHDIAVLPPREKKLPLPNIAEDDGHTQGGDINAMFAAINDLPSDDPLRADPGPPNEPRTGSAGCERAVDSGPASWYGGEGGRSGRRHAICVARLSAGTVCRKCGAVHTRGHGERCAQTESAFARGPAPAHGD